MSRSSNRKFKNLFTAFVGALVVIVFFGLVGVTIYHAGATQQTTWTFPE